MPRYFAILLVFALSGELLAGETVLVIKPENTGTDVPCSVKLDPDRYGGQMLLFDEEGNTIPCQWAEQEAQLWWIEKSLEKDRPLTRRLVIASEPGANAVEIKEGQEKVDVLIGEKLLTTYNCSPKDPKPYCWPVVGPTGKPITRAFPMVKDVPGEQTDHPHHRSWSFTFGSVNGTCFWSETNESGRIVHAKFERLESGPVFGQIVARNDWVTLDGKKQMEDVRTYRFYAMTPETLIDWEIRLIATEGPVKLGDTKEGMASFRVASSMIEKNGGRLVNSDGKIGEKECWGKQAVWCDFSGKVDGETVGIGFFDHPTSFRYPTYWMVRGYGLFGANPFGYSYFLRDKTKDGSYTIPAGGEILFKYRIYIHKGDAEEASVAEKYENYANPPVVTVKAQ